MVAYGAIAAGVRRSQKRREAKARAGTRRRAVAQKHQAKVREINSRLQEVFARYDKDKSGVLDRSQVMDIMTDLDGSTPHGTRPSEAEVDFVMNHTSPPITQVSSLEELGDMLAMYHAYSEHKTMVHDLWVKHDKDKSGALDLPQLKTLLEELNEGVEVSDEEVQLLMSHYDTDHSGDLKVECVELLVHTWYVQHEEEEAEQKRQSFRKSQSESQEKKKQSESACCAIA